MATHPLADLAWKFHDLLRAPKAREWVLGQCRKHLQMKDEEDAESPPWRSSPFEADGRIVSHLTLDEKCTWLLAFHQIVCSGEEQIGPAPWPEWRRDSESQKYGMRWGMVASNTAEAGFREEHRYHVEAWLKDVEAAIQRQEGTPRDQGEARQGEVEPRNQASDPAFSPLQYDILQALRQLKATDPEKRATALRIAECVGGDATEQSCKAPLSDLKKRCMVDSQTGRHGGSWLTGEGLGFINRVRKP